MFIKSLSVENFRSHRKFSRTFASGVTVVTGPNGSGKTTLIEAVTMALSGHSFKGVIKSCSSEMLSGGVLIYK